MIRYGNQQGAKRGYNPKKRGRASHHPLLAFLGSGYVLNVWNRSGDTGTGTVSFFHQTLILLGEDFRINRILCDSGLYLIDFIEYLEQRGASAISLGFRLAQLFNVRFYKLETGKRYPRELR